MNTIYRIKELERMAKTTIVKCPHCNNVCTSLKGDYGVQVTDKHARLIVNAICKEHGLQFNSYVL